MIEVATVEIEMGGGVAPGERPAVLLLLALLLSFGFIRMSTRLMRSPKVPWWPGSVTTGDLHIHHLVFGIVMILIAGFFEFAFVPASPWVEVLAILFGIGAGLTLDEFALWLHLEDVYWSDEGRRSVDAVAIAVVFAGLVIVAAPLDWDGEAAAIVAVVIVYRLLVSLIAVLKGKYVFGLVGFFIGPFSEIGAIRLARPDSPWARWRYGKRPKKLAKARAREVKWSRRRDRWRDLVGGAPTPPALSSDNEKSGAAKTD